MENTAESLRKPVVAVQRGVQILRYLGRLKRPAGVQEIARALDLVPSTCLHILRTLTHEGMLVMDARDKRYRLGPSLLRLARDMVGGSDFIQMVQPELDRLASGHAVTTAAAWREGEDRLIVVAKAEGSPTISINVSVGSRFPALVSAVGLSLAAVSQAPVASLRPGFEALKWQNPPTFETWCAAVEAARISGVAVDAGYYIQGVTLLATPVFDTAGRASRFLVALGFSQQIAEPAVSPLARDLRRAADGLSDLFSDDVAAA